MGIFDNAKFKKSISVVLASLSLGGATGCKKVEDKRENDMSDAQVVAKNDTTQEAKYDKALEDLDVYIPHEDVSREQVNQQEEKSDQSDALKKSIMGKTEYDRLKEILDDKEWGETEEALILQLYDVVDKNYDLRDINNPKEKQMYLRNLVDTIQNVNVIDIDPNDSVLQANNWNARADYDYNNIVMKFDNIKDLRHELAHMEKGTFLSGSEGVDLGFVLEEGRASSREGDATENTKWIDNISMDVNMADDRELIIENCNGAYPAFEEIYTNFKELGVDLEKIRREEQSVGVFSRSIENQLNKTYGNNMGTQYIESLNSYIAFFNVHGQAVVEKNEFGQDVFEVRDEMLSIMERCMSHSKDSYNREVGIER